MHQQSSTSRTRDTVELTRRETTQFTSPVMWPANTPDPNPVDYRICDMMQERVGYQVGYQCGM